MSKKLYSFPVYKTVYGMAYIIADNEKDAYGKWQSDEIPPSAMDFDDERDCDIESGCGVHEVEEWKEPLPNGVIPHGGDYREILIDRYNQLTNELNKVANLLNEMKGEN